MQKLLLATLCSSSCLALLSQEVPKITWYEIIALYVIEIAPSSLLPVSGTSNLKYPGDHSSTFILVEKYANKTIHLKWSEINHIRLLCSTWCYTNEKPSISTPQTHTPRIQLGLVPSFSFIKALHIFLFFLEVCSPSFHFLVQLLFLGNPS